MFNENWSQKSIMENLIQFIWIPSIFKIPLSSKDFPFENAIKYAWDTIFLKLFQRFKDYI